MRSILDIFSTLKAPARRLSGWILLIFPLASCSGTSPVAYSEFTDLGNKGITQDWTYTFTPAPFDSTEMKTQRFDLIFVVRYTSRCASRNVVFDMEHMSLSHSRPDSARIGVTLFDDDGSPRGKGNFGVFECTDTLARGMMVPDGYVVSVSSPLPARQTEGVIGFGMKLIRTGEQEPDIRKILRLE